MKNNQSFSKGGRRPGAGRPKGVPNKLTGAVKEMVLAALHGVGGVDYLKEQAKENPTAFMGLIGRVIPTELHGPGDKGEHITRIEEVIVDHA